MTDRLFDPDAAAPEDSGIFGLIDTPADARVVLVPVPFEATTSYGGGAAEGPAAILHASRQVDLFDIETGAAYEVGIAMLPDDGAIRKLNDEAKALAAPIIAVGGRLDGPGLTRNLDRVNALCEEMNRQVYETTRGFLNRGKLVGIIGGDHSVPFGAMKAYAEKYPSFGVLHLDAHADLREAYEGFRHSHASIMYNVVKDIPEVTRLVQVGLRDVGQAELELIKSSGGRIAAHFDAELKERAFEGVPWNRQLEAIVKDLPENVYLSFDIDGLDPTLCPHTGTPVPGGLSFHETCALIKAVAKSGRRIIGFDLDEVAAESGGSEWDGNVGARLLYKMIGWAVRTQPA